MKYERVKEICQPFSSSILINRVKDDNGTYPLWGAKGLVKNISSYQQSAPYISIVKWGAGVGRVELRPGKSSIVATMQGILPNDNIDIEWLCRALRYLHLERYATQATVPNLYFRDYGEAFLQVPGHNEQKHIAEILKKIEVIIKKKKETINRLDLLIKARFVEMFGRPNRNEKQYPEYITSEVFNLQMGKTPSRDNKDFWGDGHDWISIRDIGSFDRYTSATKEQITDFGVKSSGIKIVPQNTVIMSFKLSIGRVAITSKPSYTNEAIMAFIDKGTVPINTTYLCELFKLVDWNEGANSAAMGKTLNKATLSKKAIQIPDLELQNQFADFVHQVDKSKFVIQK